MADESTDAEAMAKPLPPEFDPAYYRSIHPDLAEFDDSRAADHFREWGLLEGRAGSNACLREDFLANVVGQIDGPILEIGPFCSPVVTGPNISYLDVLDADGLRARASAQGLDQTGCPAHVNFVGDLTAIDRRFAAIIGSHSIEHQPDLVRHFQAIAERLDVGGRYLLIIPDKRFCFDVFNAESTVGSVLQAYRDQRTRHTLQSVIEHRAYTTHNDPVRHWARDHGGEDFAAIDRISGAISEFDAAGGNYIDVHAWYFTPDNFRAIVAGLLQLGLTALAPTRIYNTPSGRLEFCAVLERQY